jgi:hypothetical protein
MFDEVWATVFAEHAARCGDEASVLTAAHSCMVTTVLAENISEVRGTLARVWRRGLHETLK